MTVQVIERDGKPEWAVIPYKEYKRLQEDADMLQDIRAYDEAKSELENGKELTVPGEVAFAIADGQHPVKAWRIYRKLSQKQLAEKADMPVVVLRQMEKGQQIEGPSDLQTIARALEVEIAALVDFD